MNCTNQKATRRLITNSAHFHLFSEMKLVNYLKTTETMKCKLEKKTMCVAQANLRPKPLYSSSAAVLPVEAMVSSSSVVG